MPNHSNKLSQFWQELKRRKVIKVIAMYAATAFIIMEAADIMLPRLGLPDWTVTLIIILLIVGFPIALILSWIFDITPEGLLKTESVKEEKKKTIPRQPIRRLIKVNNIVITILFIAVCILLYPKIFRQDRFEKIRDAEVESIELIAVLPFSNLRADPETDYLGFAIANQIIGGLVYLKNISVRPSSSIRKYEKQAIDSKEVGDELQVDYVLIGNYLKEANIIRLTVELVEVNTNKMIWREPIEVDFNNVFELQDTVAQMVVEGMNVQFSQQEMNRIRKDIPENPLAYEYYLRSISYPHTNEGDQLAIEMLKNSIELDSSYAPAYDQIGFRIKGLAQFGLLDPEETNRAENYFLKAISLNGVLLSALGNLAILYTETNRTEEAVKITRQMLDINPNNAKSHYSLGYIYRYAGMLNESVLEMEKAVALDPQNAEFRSYGVTYMNVGEYEKAFKAFEIDKGSAYALGWQGATLFRQGNPELAIEYFRRVIAMEHEKLWGLATSAIKAFIEGNINEGIIAMRKLEKANIADAESWYYWASNYALLGDRAGCIRALQRAVDGGYFNYPFMLNDFYLDSIRNDPEFQIILEKAKEKHIAFRKKLF
jgi:TolB-like protein/Tfp pilus assembly protein PilF